MSGQRRDTEERTGEYGGDDGAMEHEQALVAPGEDPGSAWESPGDAPQGQSRAEHKQEQDLQSGEENPG